MSETPNVETPNVETPNVETPNVETPNVPTPNVPAPTPAPERRRNQGSAGGGNAVYGLGLIGALVYFVQQADGFAGFVLAVLKALVWPAFLVYEAFRVVHGS